MNFLHNISINRRMQIVILSFLLVFFSISTITVYHITSMQLMETTQKQMEVYLEKLSQHINEIVKNSETGFDHNAYSTLKPIFSQPAYFNSDYPFLVDFSGNLTIHLYKEGQRYPKEYLNNMFSETQKEGSFNFKEYRNNKQHKMIVFFRRADSLNAFIGISVDLNEVFFRVNKNFLLIWLLVVAGSLMSIMLISQLLKPILKAAKRINLVIVNMSRGEIGKTIEYDSKDEIGQMVVSLNELVQGMEQITNFANEIGNKKLDSEFKPLGPNDKLGNALIDLRESLKKASAEEAKRKEEDNRRIWINTGLAKFGDILRQNNNNLQVLADHIMQNLINYLDANQGGLFLLNQENNEEPILDLLSAFAFNRKKAKKKTILLGEGLVGNCAIEKHTVYLKEIPDDYIEITSGLGDSPPRTLLIVPLKLEEKVFGVLEIASFKEFLPHEIEFIEKIGESIASTLSAVRNNIRTNELLEQSQQQKEEMQAQEEEMRQNMEEMQATQEEMARKTIEMEGMTSAINEALLFAELTEKGAFIISNPMLQSLLGHGKVELEGKTIHDFINPYEANAFKNIWNEIKSGIAYKGTLQWVNKQQGKLFILCSITPSFDEHENLYKIFLLGQDVTQSKLLELKAQKQAEEIEQNLQELQLEQELSLQREEEMRALLEALDSTCLVSELDKNGKIIFINKKNVETLGDSKGDIEGKYHHEIDFQAQANPEHYQKFWDEIISGIPKHREFSLDVKGKTKWISEYYTPIMDSDANVVKVIIIGIDITESKETEEMLIKQIDELKKTLKK